VTAADVTAIHQLLGRLAYFHALFIEPALSTSNLTCRDPLTRACCNHRSARAAHPTVMAALKPTAWNVVHELGEAVHLTASPECVACDTCCAVCRVLLCGTAVTAAWITAECRAYQRSRPDPETSAVWALAAGTRLAAAFSAQFQATCPRLEQAAGLVSPPIPDRAGLSGLPLTSELLALWENPAAISRKPVTSWLNHCTDLDDIARQRSDRTRS
jgi:hypothetical protein